MELSRCDQVGIERESSKLISAEGAEAESSNPWSQHDACRNSDEVASAVSYKWHRELYMLMKPHGNIRTSRRAGRACRASFGIEDIDEV